jgi:hypothetical protein
LGTWRCANAEPAALLAAALVLPSLKTCEAADAAIAEVILRGATCANALPAAALDALPVDLLDRIVDEVFAICLLVTLVTMCTFYFR